MGQPDEYAFRIVVDGRKHHRPRFSLIIVTYNRPDLLRRCLESTLEQPLTPEIEVIVVDNGSDVPIEESALDLLRGFPSGSLLRRDQNVFSIEPWRAALSFARGQYALLPGDDDVLQPQYMQVFSEMSEATNVSLMAAGMRHVSQEDLALGVYSIPPTYGGTGAWMGELLSTNPFGMPATAFLTTDLDLSSVPSTRFAFDWWLWNISASRGQIVTSAEIVLDYRVHAGQQRHKFSHHVTALEGARTLTSVLGNEQWQYRLFQLSDGEVSELCDRVLNGPGMNHGESRWSPLLQVHLADLLARRRNSELAAQLVAQALGRLNSPLDHDFLATFVGRQLRGDARQEYERTYARARGEERTLEDSAMRGDVRLPALLPARRLLAQMPGGERVLRNLTTYRKRRR